MSILVTVAENKCHAKGGFSKALKDRQNFHTGGGQGRGEVKSVQTKGGNEQETFMRPAGIILAERNNSR